MSSTVADLVQCLLTVNQGWDSSCETLTPNDSIARKMQATLTFAGGFESIILEKLTNYKFDAEQIGQLTHPSNQAAGQHGNSPLKKVGMHPNRNLVN